MKPLILVDENIPQAENYFGDLGHIQRFAGRSLTREQLGDAKALIVRSVTSVTEVLLADSQIDFVGTCTIGTDHVDQQYLNSRNIGFASAPGCNANSVAEYILAALAHMDVNWQSVSVGIIGCGNVGGSVYRKLLLLGADVCGYDPLIDPSLFPKIVSIEQVLSADVVCLHTPLTRDGAFPTHHLLTEKHLERLKPGAILINAGRGAVIDNDHLLKIAQQRPDLKLVLDVWEFEPWLSAPLLENVVIGTPHIAGYSWDGKVAGSKMIAKALRQHWHLAGIEDVKTSSLVVSNHLALPLTQQDWQQVRNIILAAYDIVGDDKRLRAMVLAAKTDVDIENGFDTLRKTYPERREFAFSGELTPTVSSAIKATLEILGFKFTATA